MKKSLVAIILSATLILSSCGSEVAITTQDSSVVPTATDAPEEKVEIIKGKSLDKIGYKCEAPSGIEIEKDIFLDRKSSTGEASGDMGANEILGEDTYTLISVYFYGPHSLGSTMLNFMYLQAFSTADVNDKNSIIIGEDVYSFDDLQPYLVFKTDDICVYDVYALTGDDDLQTKITEQIGFQNEAVTNCVNATEEDRRKHSIIMTEEDYVTYEDYNYLHKIAEYYKTHIGEMIVKKSKPDDNNTPPALVDEESVWWNSVLVQYSVGPNPKGAGWYIWQNLLEDTETIMRLWEIVDKTQSTVPHRFQHAPDGGFPFEVNFISDGMTIECAFFSQCVRVDGVWYEFTNEGYEEVLSLTGWKVKQA